MMLRVHSFILLSVAVIAGCDSPATFEDVEQARDEVVEELEELREAEQELSEKRQETEEAQRELQKVEAEYERSREREQFLSERRQELNALDAKIQTLRTAHVDDAENGSSFSERLEEIEERRESAKDALQDLEDADLDEWPTHRGEVEQALDQLRRAVQDAQQLVGQSPAAAEANES